ncbi:MAG TPA: prolipoprotein diacylglyceryl transferase [Patescibacteria group bacterium]|nr:prolipoprotein diacylglyceryl transferase [Patescibacteria group bacterium]
MPQYFSIGPLRVHYYGLTMALAVAAGFFISLRRAPAFGLPAALAEDLLLYLAIGGFLGARLYHVLSDWPYYFQHPLSALAVWHGGLSIYGAVLGGAATLLLFKKIRRLRVPALKLLDWLAPALLAGQIIGRLGNLFNYEAFGYPTGLPWKMFVPPQFRPPAFAGSEFFHPFFLYEMLGNLIIFFVLKKMETARQRPAGALFFFYLLLYNLLRCALEFLRTDSTFLPGGLRLNVLASLLLATAAALAIFYLYRHKNPHAEIS